MHNKLTIIVALAVLSVFGVIASGQDADPTQPAVGRRAVTNDETPPPALDCEFMWFFDELEPATCPDGEPFTGEAVFQRFEYGYMIWMQPTDMIYVMHSTQQNPRWLAVPDPYVAGMPERDFSWSEEQPPQSAQPRLGFGALWREDDTLRERIGWAVQQWEFVYEGRVQTAEDGTIYVEEPNGGVFVLLPGADDWELYADRQ